MSTSVVVDTDVFSYLLKLDSRGAAFASHLSGTNPLLSAMTVAEARRWALERGWGEKRVRLLDETLERYSVAPLTEVTAALWAKVYVARAKAGKPISANDCWVAATALEFNVSLITNNVRHFTSVPGFRVLGPDE